MNKIKVIVKRTDEEYGHVTCISDRLENFQKIVGGYIQTVDLPKGLVCICNEEGKLLNLPKNFIIPGDVIVGDVILCGAADDVFCDIPVEFDYWKTLLKNLEKNAWA